MAHMDAPHSGPYTGRFLQWIGRLYLAFFGWKIEGGLPDLPKAVFIAAPHTSNWDLPFMMAVAWSLRMRPSWMGKHTLFEGPFAGFMRWLGGFPVDRRGRQNLVQQVAEHIRTSERIYVAIPPAGTRKYTDHWKSGFYQIALAAGVPVVCGYLDFKRKVGGLGPAIELTGDRKADMDRFRAFYGPIEGQIPAFKSLIRLKEEGEEQARAAGGGGD